MLCKPHQHRASRQGISTAVQRYSGRRGRMDREIIRWSLFVGTYGMMAASETTVSSIMGFIDLSSFQSIGKNH